MFRISSGDRCPTRSGGAVGSLAGVPLSSGARLARRLRFGRPASVVGGVAGGSSDAGADAATGGKDVVWDGAAGGGKCGLGGLGGKGEAGGSSRDSGAWARPGRPLSVNAAVVQRVEVSAGSSQRLVGPVWWPSLPGGWPHRCDGSSSSAGVSGASVQSLDAGCGSGRVHGPECSPFLPLSELPTPFRSATNQLERIVANTGRSSMSGRSSPSPLLDAAGAPTGISSPNSLGSAEPPSGSVNEPAGTAPEVSS